MSSIQSPGQSPLARFSQALVAPNGQIELRAGSDGNLVLSVLGDDNVPQDVRQTEIRGNDVTATMQPNEAFELCAAGGNGQDNATPLFTFPINIPGSFLRVQWATGNSSLLSPGQFLQGRFNQSILSPSRQIRLQMQSNGNLVLRHLGNANVSPHDIWQTGTQGDNVVAIMEGRSGALELRVGGDGGPLLYTSNTNISGSFLQVQDDGRAVIYRPGDPRSIPIWANGINI